MEKPVSAGILPRGLGILPGMAAFSSGRYKPGDWEGIGRCKPGSCEVHACYKPGAGRIQANRAPGQGIRKAWKPAPGAISLEPSGVSLRAQLSRWLW
jgi:hypothetical protein